MPARPGFWRKCRTGFRWLRIAVLFALLAMVCALGWFNRVGLPDFLKRRLVAGLQTRGIDLSFSRMRLHWVHGLVIENVRIGHAQAPDDPVLTLAEIQLHPDYRTLWSRQWQIDRLELRQGKLVWPLTPTNALKLDHMQAELRFQTNDTWSLDNFQADFAGAKLAVSGDISQASRLRQLPFFQHRTSAGLEAWRAGLRKFADALDRIHFAEAPQLSLVVDGDASDVHSLAVRLNLNAPGVQTPWGGAHNVLLTANLTVPGDLPTPAEASLAWWTNALPYRLSWTVQLQDLTSAVLNADWLVCNGVWRAPELTVTRLSAGLGGGHMNAVARLDVTTRELTFTNASSFDVHALDALLTEKTRERLAEFSWTRPPSLQGSGSLILPAWTNRAPDWRDDVQPTIQLNGELTFQNGTVLGALLDWVHTHFTYSNLLWRLPDLAVVKANTRLALSGGEDDRTRFYRWHIRGQFDPVAIRPFLTTSNAAHGLSHFTFTEPLALDLDVEGHLYDYDSIGANGRVALTNFTIRGQSVDSVEGAFRYTNHVLVFLKPRLWHETQTMTADTITLDFNTRIVHFTNGFSTADPRLVSYAIGPKTGRALEPYQFLQPPTARVNGRIPLRDMNGPRDAEGADLQFDVVEGGPFQWLKFHSPDITGTIHWMGATLVLTNVQAAFCGGTGRGQAFFDFQVPHPGADYDFSATVTNVDLHQLAADLSSPTNRLEGMLAGKLVVTHGDSRNWRTWDGFGHASLRDGLLWDIPIFGILSPVLNTFSSGLGNSRATDATGRFTITNGVIYSDSLKVQSTMMRLDYRGTVDLNQNVNARVTAQLLHNTWVIGPVISTMLWPVSKLFEYHVTGTLKDPKSEPVYIIPKILLLPLHPIHGLQGLLPGGDTPTNSPSRK